MRKITYILVAVIITVLSFASFAQAVNVGYYEMCEGEGEPIQTPPITTAGHTPIQIFDLTPAELLTIDVLFVTNCSNLAFGGEYLARRGDIQTAVSNGMILSIHDRFVTGANTILPGGGAFFILRSLGVAINVSDGSTLVTNGPGGTINNTTLDGGNLSNHGFAISGSLPGDAKKILSTADPNRIVTFSYSFGGGQVIYSTIPLDFYLKGLGIVAAFKDIYAPNVVAYAASLVNEAPVADAGTDQTILIGNTVTLDGSGSSDADSDPLIFSWSLTTVPTGSTATLSDPTAVGPTFFVDLAGNYVAQLIVNDGTVDSTADTVNVFGNTAPTCVLVGNNPQPVPHGVLFSIQVRGTDPDDGQQLTMAATGVPTGATLNPAAGTTQASPFTTAFNWTPPAPGMTTVTATFSDSFESCSISFTIDAINIAPVCDPVGPLPAGFSVYAATTIPLSARDANGDSLTMTSVSLPADPSATLTPPSGTSQEPSFDPFDVEFSWRPQEEIEETVQLKFADGFGGDCRSTYVINAAFDAPLIGTLEDPCFNYPGTGSMILPLDEGGFVTQDTSLYECFPFHDCRNNPENLRLLVDGITPAFGECPNITVPVPPKRLFTGGLLRVPSNAQNANFGGRTFKDNPTWNILEGGKDITCSCYDFTKRFPFTCATDGTVQIPDECGGGPL